MLILSLTIVKLFLVVSFLLDIQPKTCMHSSTPPCVSYAHPISPSFSWTFWLYLATSTSYEAPHYAVFSSLLLFHASSVQIFFSAPCSQIPIKFCVHLSSTLHDTCTADFVFSDFMALIIYHAKQEWKTSSHNDLSTFNWQIQKLETVRFSKDISRHFLAKHN
jgi:hypothetical protein